MSINRTRGDHMENHICQSGLLQLSGFWHCANQCLPLNCHSTCNSSQSNNPQDSD